MILHEGTILGKWNYRNAPSVNQLQPNMIATLLDQQNSLAEYLKTGLLVLAVILFYLFFTRLKSVYKQN